MATCIYCGKKVGLFSRYHEACASEAKKNAIEAEKNREIGLQGIKDYLTVALTNKEPSSEVQNRLNKIASQYKLSPEIVGQAVVGKVYDLSREEPVGAVEFNYIFQLLESILGKFDTLPHDSPFYHSYPLAAHSLALSHRLWLVMQGTKVELGTPCDVVLQPGESRLAEFGTVLYRKSVLVPSHVGGYNGVAVRVASGLYYRFGGYAGHTVSSPELQNLDSGFVVLTNLSMYFGGQQTTFRIPYNSILRFKAYPDGLGFFRSIGAGREEIFTIIDPQFTRQGWSPENTTPLHVGWFLYNLVTFLTTSNRS